MTWLDECANEYISRQWKNHRRQINLPMAREELFGGMNIYTECEDGGRIYTFSDKDYLFMNCWPVTFSRFGELDVPMNFKSDKLPAKIYISDKEGGEAVCFALVDKNGHRWNLCVN